MKFKDVKCALLSFSRRKQKFMTRDVIYDKPISAKSTHRDLGVTASSDLTWSAHYNNVASRAYRTLGLLRRTFNSVQSVHAVKLLYTTMVRPQLMYCSQVWRPCYIKDIVKLEKVQRRATKYILGDWKSNYRQWLEKLQLLPLMSMFELNDIMFCVKSLKHPTDHFNINDYVSFNDNNIRSGSQHRMCHRRSSTLLSNNSYFMCLPRLDKDCPFAFIFGVGTNYSIFHSPVVIRCLSCRYLHT